MSNFTSARIRLTIWYVAIVAIVSFAFSAIIFRDVTGEIERGFQMAEIRLRTQNDTLLPPGLALKLLNRDLEQAKKSVLLRLIITDGVILLASGVAAYILAGKTLQPLILSLEGQKRFLADASHELRTPITSLRTELEVALRDKKLGLKDAKDLLKSNLEEVIDLQNLSEKLMRLTRYSQSINGIRARSLNIKIPLEQAIKKVAPMAKVKNIKIKKDISNMEIKADSQSLEELFVNLLDNAIKYSPDNSVVHVSTLLQPRLPSLRSGVSGQGSKVLIEVRDHGVGIAKADIPHLFDRFYRADASRNKTKAGGYGLGLAIAKEIVERHKGEIAVKSTLGKGSTFTVVLPS